MIEHLPWSMNAKRGKKMYKIIKELTSRERRHLKTVFEKFELKMVNSSGAED